MHCCIPIIVLVSIPIPQKYLGEVEKALVTAFVVDIIINYSVPLAIIRTFSYFFFVYLNTLIFNLYFLLGQNNKTNILIWLMLVS